MPMLHQQGIDSSVMIGFRTWMAVACLVLLCVGCDHSAKPAARGAVKSEPEEFDAALDALVASKDEYEAASRWNAMRHNLDVASASQVDRWLELQQMILTNSAAPYAQQSLRRSAIQEFYTLFEHARPYREWLEKCKTDEVFKDPFVSQNIDMILDVLKKTNRNAPSSR